jgi:hypothetical protein
MQTAIWSRDGRIYRVKCPFCVRTIAFKRSEITDEFIDEHGEDSAQVTCGYCHTLWHITLLRGGAARLESSSDRVHRTAANVVDAARAIANNGACPICKQQVNTITTFVAEDFPLTEAEAASLTDEDRRVLEKWFLEGLGDWDEAASAAVDIWRREKERA